MAVVGVNAFPGQPSLIVPGGPVVGVIYNIGSVAVQLSENLNGLQSPTSVQNGAFTDGFPLQPGDSFAILLGWNLPLYASSLLPGALLTVILSYPCGALLSSGRSAEGNAPDKFSNPPSSGTGTSAPSGGGGSAPGAPLPVAPQPAPTGGGGTSTPTSSGGTSSPTTYLGSTPPRIVTATIA